MTLALQYLNLINMLLDMNQLRTHCNMILR